MVTGIIILIGSLRCLKEAKAMHMILGLSVNFKNSFLISSNIRYWCILELSHKGNSNVFCLFVCIVALRPKSTAMVIAGRSVHLTTLFPGQA